MVLIFGTGESRGLSLFPRFPIPPFSFFKWVSSVDPLSFAAEAFSTLLGLAGLAIPCLRGLLAESGHVPTSR